MLNDDDARSGCLYTGLGAELARNSMVANERGT